MKKNITVALPVVLVVLAAAILPVLRGGTPTLSEAESISVLAGGAEAVISDPGDIRAMTAVFSKIPSTDMPSCPFGAVDIQVRTKSGDVHVFPATDGCYIFKINNKYILASGEEWEQVSEVLEKYGISIEEQTARTKIGEDKN
ncbi:MAG: hypothetical protein LBH86_03085 [Oscillospiraceae bacterium]|nr:hypothetical protein [Oscillospiraceae bacterium]